MSQDVLLGKVKTVCAFVWLGIAQLQLSRFELHWENLVTSTEVCAKVVPSSVHEWKTFFWKNFRSHNSCANRHIHLRNVISSMPNHPSCLCLSHTGEVIHRMCCTKSLNFFSCCSCCSNVNTLALDKVKTVFLLLPKVVWRVFTVKHYFDKATC